MTQEQATSMTQFQKVASSPDALADHDDADPTRSAETGAVRSPGAGDPDDRDDPDGGAGKTTALPSAIGTTPDDRDQADSATGPHEVAAPVAAVPADTPGTQAGAPAAPVAAVPADTPGTQAGAPAEPELRPGEAGALPGDFSDLTYGSLLPDASEFRQRWQQIQFGFVDDPRGSVTEAADVIAQVTAELEAAIAERQRVIAERQRSLRATWSEGMNADTETMRVTLLMYRALLDQLTGAGS